MSNDAFFAERKEATDAVLDRIVHVGVDSGIRDWGFVARDSLLARDFHGTNEIVAAIINVPKSAANPKRRASTHFVSRLTAWKGVRWGMKHPSMIPACDAFPNGDLFTQFKQLLTENDPDLVTPELANLILQLGMFRGVVYPPKEVSSV